MKFLISLKLLIQANLLKRNPLLYLILKIFLMVIKVILYKDFYFPIPIDYIQEVAQHILKSIIFPQKIIHNQRNHLNGSLSCIHSSQLVFKT
ncbi:unnamed protein product [Paramecium sonneborni]|uniref:Uncharacterized protein n=1 Tax=Paramecium sonneborni TaxID=65129 RepID=A0A8S1R3M8_9CILI|nr:unnamed protein product [Paramecium sonneborni]